MKKYFLLVNISLLLLMSCNAKHDMQSEKFIDKTKRAFPIENYEQNPIKSLLLDQQKLEQHVFNQQEQDKYFIDFKENYLAINSATAKNAVWSAEYINKILSKESKENIFNYLEYFRSTLQKDKYGLNYKQISDNLKKELLDNQNVNFQNVFNSRNRAIITQETAVRLMPDNKPIFNNSQEAGEGFPFDVLQNSSLPLATPVYVVGETKDKAWSLVLANSVAGWVATDHLAHVDNTFYKQWIKKTNNNLGAIIKYNPSIYSAGKNFITSVKIGTVLPILESNSEKGETKILFPIRSFSGQAILKPAIIQATDISKMPLSPTVKNFVNLITQMQGREYGWGNLYFENDCSAELKRLFTAFGIFLPRNTEDQSNVGKALDISQLNSKDRIEYIAKKAKPFSTLIYIKGHIMLYVGNTIINGNSVPLVYNNIWGFRPANNSYRSIVGGSYFMPLLTKYSENSSLVPLTEKPIMKLIFLN